MTVSKDNLEEFVIKVTAMRSSQKEYFKTRSQKALMDAKRFEYNVDLMLGDTKKPETQTDLFK